MVEDHLLQVGEGNIAGDCVLVAEVYLHDDFATLNKGADNLHAGATAEPAVSDGDGGVQEN